MTTEHLEIDHVVLGVTDLQDAAVELLEDHGLVALPGGSHSSWGTANRIVPLGTSYLELVAVLEPEVARASAFAGWVADMAAGRCGWGWAVRTRDIPATAARLGLDVVPGSRVTPSGTELRWRLAGVPDADGDRTLPFFIGWGDGTPMPGTSYAEHRRTAVRLGGIAVETDAHVLGEWLDFAELPVVVRHGRRGVVAVELATDDGAVVLEPGL